MAALDALPEVEKTSLFGTAVHAVLRIGRRPTSATVEAALTRSGPDDHVGCARRRRRSKTCSSTWSSRSARARACAKTIAVATKELRQIGRDRRTLLILLFVPAMFLLLYGYALNFDIRNVRLAVEDRDRIGAKPRRWSRRSSIRATSIWPPT